MTTWKAVVRYFDEREVIIDAETEEEASAKLDSGDFKIGHSVDYYAYDLVSDPEKVDAE